MQCKPMLSLHIPQGEFAAGAAIFTTWLDAVASCAAPGSKLVLLAHNGASFDWPILTANLLHARMALPGCVSLLGCSRELFVAGKERTLRRLWSMRAIHRARFGRDVPNAHTAEGDVR
jgi:hypothetical protein